MVPFRLTFTLSRRQRLAVELMPWLPAIAASLGFTIGAAFLATNASPRFLLLLLIPPVVYRGLIAFVFDLVVRGGLPVEVSVDEAHCEIATRGSRRTFALAGIFQVFKAGETWTVLHLDGSVLTIPANAVTREQIDYLRSFTQRAASARVEPQS
ncbi:unnamed protein product [Gemmata massiliana]|uniref:YcxB-like protein domain-containing protein n=1 Tax=Gemmata massiliana TaxID=1210884 RepID=A0A6P2DMF7_9BACT|nr:hypothetical protein [Gemmata massiliana]VTS03758.1 unnamed protein product [Gemmata massiliana]